MSLLQLRESFFVLFTLRLALAGEYAFNIVLQIDLI